YGVSGGLKTGPGRLRGIAADDRQVNREARDAPGDARGAKFGAAATRLSELDPFAQVRELSLDLFESLHNVAQRRNPIWIIQARHVANEAAVFVSPVTFGLVAAGRAKRNRLR
ncbi:MAG TPA: hypothetical protein VKS60_18355, partial [Stellaceae bacterium]|nr:hypothetical protein [Stellaceae bacterium]